ncbi:MAG TPA: PAS domain-containing sensor histidine kinase [Actinomycetes bacterium]|nr:PAS domain-containing sensor histidine kinase [Actinomycetes bacterium]
MPSLQDLALTRTDLSAEDLDWLHLLLADWQMLADLSFADLLLWLPLRDRGGFVAAAQMRPTTGPTAHHDDVVGTEVPRGRRPQLDRAYDEQRICRERDPDWPGDVPVREETIPVVRDGRAVAVVSRHTNLAAARTPSRLELTYLRTADDLAVMVSEGRFPVAGAEHQVVLAPRVGDGLIRLDEKGVVTFASPNALSAYRRLGLAADLTGTHLGEVTAELAGAADRAEPVDEALAMVVSGWAAREAEVEAGGTTVRLRVVPLTPHGVRTAALVLCRDVTEVRRRERELVGKDATIREIHHRVKNNLQTVAALLRLQSRRLGSSDTIARDALREAEQRIGSIALVHETLARAGEDGVDFDEVADRVAGMVGNLGGQGDVRVARTGSFGLLGPEVATPLALVLVELVQNAVEHGLGAAGGQVGLEVRQQPGELRVAVTDKGGGLPDGFAISSHAGLGLQIVRTLVEAELGGQLTVTAGEKRGTRVEVRVPRPLG